jgi:hypothetical protein
MSNVEQYRQRARECLREAQDSSNDSDKALLLAMRRAWLNLVDLVPGQDEAKRERRRQRRLQRLATADSSDSR